MHSNAICNKKPIRVWIIQTGEPLHSDPGTPRSMRAMNLANALVKDGNDVIIWSSAFYHQEKIHRSSQFKSIKISDRLIINLIPSPGYRSNISIMRFLDHLVLAKNLFNKLNEEKMAPDIAVIGYPPIEVAFATALYCKTKKVASMLDVKDQWPDLLLEYIPHPFKSTVKILLWPYYFFAKKTFQMVTGISAVSNDYLQWCSVFSKRPIGEHNKVFPLTTQREPLSEIQRLKSTESLKRKGICNDPSIIRIIFIGSFTKSFNFKPIKDAANLCNKNKINVQFILCGAGDETAEIIQSMKDIPNILFPGWLDRHEIECLSAMSHLALAPYKKIQNFENNIPNKILDYISSGVPIMTALDGEVKRLIDKHSIGMQYKENDPYSLYNCIKELLGDQAELSSMATRAKSLFENEFSYDKVYNDYTRHLKNIAQINQH